MAFAARLSSLSRGHDVVVRWGGEEFLWMLRELHMHDAPAVAERIRRVIAEAAAQTDGITIDIRRMLMCRALQPLPGNNKVTLMMRQQCC